MPVWKLFGMSLLLLCTSNLAVAQESLKKDSVDNKIFESIIKSASTLNITLGPSHSPSKRKLNDIQSNAKFLQDLFASTGESQLPPVYAQSLSLDAKILVRLVKETRDRKYHKSEVYADVQNVAVDLSIKVAHIKYSRGGAIKNIQVVVHTKRADQEVTGYEVWYVPKGWASEQSAFIRFDRVSSPTSMDLAPGNYFIWLQSGQTKTSRLPVKLGGDGKSRRDIDLIVP